MIKKIITLVILSAVSLFAVSAFSTKASTTFSIFDNKTSFFYSWSGINTSTGMGSNGSSIQKDDIYIDDSYISSEIEINTMMEINGTVKQVFQRSNAKKTANLRVYVNASTNSPILATYYFNYVNGDLSKMRAYDENNIEFDATDYKGYYFDFLIPISDGLKFDEFNLIKDILIAEPKDYVTVNFTVDAIEVDPDNPSELPDTVGSIFNDSNRVGRVTHTVNGYDVNFSILYEGIIYSLDYTFSSTTDMTIFDRSFEIYYFTYNDERYMLFNHGEQSMFTRQTSDSVFIPYTLWNMDTNELSSFERYNVYMYLRKEAAMSVTAYFYVDDFVIDNLLSATVNMEYRYVNILGVKRSWQPYMKVLESEDTNQSAVSWKPIAASIATTATTIGAMSGIGWPLFLLGTAVSAYLQVKTYEELVDSGGLFIGETNEIVPVTPNVSLLNEINTAYAEMYENFDPVTANTQYDIFKLNFGSFDKFFMDKIEIKDDSFYLATFTYVTDGNMYVEVAEEDYNVIVNPGELEETPDDDPNFVQQFLDFLETWGKTVIVIVGILAGLFILYWASKTSGSVLSLFDKPGKLVIFGAIVIGILKILNII